MNEYEKTNDRRASPWPRYFLLGSVVLMAALVMVEWYFRFDRYHFEMQLFHLPARPLAVQTLAPGFTTNDVPAVLGGDLTALIGIQRAAATYQEWHPAGYRVHDEQGYVTGSYDPGVTPDAVVVGDSFMTVGLLTNTFAARLAGQSGLNVRNRALLGHGPFVGVEHYLDSLRPGDSPPAFLVWGFAEREISGAKFERFLYSMDGRVRMIGPKHETMILDRGFSVHWDSLAPTRLKESLPASSLLAQSAQWMWNRLRYLLFGQLHPDLIPARADVVDGPMLFYRYHLESLALSAEERDVDQVVQAILKLDKLCRLRGMHLIVVLIPEKEQVYRDWIPARYHSPARPLPPSSLGPITAALQEQQVRVVNMLPVFTAATERGQRVYWRDDTHWNPLGVEMAAAEVWRVMQSSLPPGAVTHLETVGKGILP